MILFQIFWQKATRGFNLNRFNFGLFDIWDIYILRVNGSTVYLTDVCLLQKCIRQNNLSKVLFISANYTLSNTQKIPEV